MRKVKPIRDEDGLAVDFEIEGKYPQFGNNDPRVDDMAVYVLSQRFIKKFRNCTPTVTLSRLSRFWTITSNVVYGKNR
ncbi:pyruvate formate lyase family protein [Shigella flexneri]